jgi:hypothetical protein
MRDPDCLIFFLFLPPQKKDSNKTMETMSSSPEEEEYHSTSSPIDPPYPDDVDYDDDDELPRSTANQLPPLSYDDYVDDDDDGDGDGDGDGDVDDDDDDDDGDFHVRRMKTHSKLRSYEAKRRMAYESKLQSSSLYWRAFRTLMHDGLLETTRADLLVRGWAYATRSYCDMMRSVGEFCIDDRGVPIVDPRRKKKFMDANANAAASPNNNAGDASSARVVGIAGGGGTASSSTVVVSVGGASGGSIVVGGGGDGNVQQHPPPAGNNRKGTSAIFLDYYRGEKCGSVVGGFGDTAIDVADKYDDFVRLMNVEVLPELSS